MTPPRRRTPARTTGPGSRRPRAFNPSPSLQHAVLASVPWSVVLLAVFVPLATWRYEKAVSR
ncbi:hypothetical protein GCM10023196_065380 [Actinoallomurus vinaceus]|uniref:ABC transporter permease n=1 Tax=Actinoallomurus vinaceus TaxID=1080074 RepID=A0ABP8UJ24_9ACTN